MEDTTLLLTTPQIVSTVTVGVTIPTVLTVAGQMPTSTTACAFATLLLWIASLFTESVLSGGEEAASYIRVCARLLALTGVGEAAVSLKNTIAHRTASPNPRVRSYEITSMLVCGFLVVGQLLYALEEVLPADIDSAVVLGVVVASVSFSLRDTVSSFIGGVFDSLAPRFSVGDKIEVDGRAWTVQSKTLCYVHCNDNNGSKLTIPHGMLSHERTIVADAMQT